MNLMTNQVAYRTCPCCHKIKLADDFVGPTCLRCEDSEEEQKQEEYWEARAEEEKE